MVDGGDHQLDQHALDTLVRRRGYDEKILVFMKTCLPSIAVQWLEQGLEVREPSLPYLDSPELDSLRSDPRFQDIRRRIGLPG
jgi:hypothetical protein